MREIDLGEEGMGVEVLVLRVGDGLEEGDDDRARLGEELLLGPEVVSAVCDDGKERTLDKVSERGGRRGEDLDVERKVERALLERGELAVGRASALGRHGKGTTPEIGE